MYMFVCIHTNKRTQTYVYWLTSFILIFQTIQIRTTMPICAVQGCSNGDYTLKPWKEQDCSVHTGFKHGIGKCVCPPPFSLHPFPTEKKDVQGRRTWAQLVNRKEADGKKLDPKAVLQGMLQAFCRWASNYPESIPHTPSWIQPVFHP